MVHDGGICLWTMARAHISVVDRASRAYPSRMPCSRNADLAFEAIRTQYE